MGTTTEGRENMYKTTREMDVFMCVSGIETGRFGRRESDMDENGRDPPSRGEKMERM